MIELTEQQQLQLDGSEPIAVDPRTNAEYFLVRKEVYERLRCILDDDDARLMAALLAELDSEDWEDASAYEGKP